ncbi:MAG: TauD/TfdA family dioxygenase [Phenylobacterium sp.]|uniref:TauD/TfdA dioxygenase family protein n=1 Tax=Phenylobacterium sp. TaxID=1871053 RepID=UPI001A58C93F|nr:TauD/TfdA family dioxygenase [Phenylobacterium sp.]MBL8554556.1 TauD/TfdA family dioxygenase [Phenylobacterium sp.]
MHREALLAIEAIVKAEREPYETIRVNPLTPVIGAEIEGVDLAGDLSNRQFAEVRRAFLEHHILVFRDQRLSPEDHKRFGRRFGRLHVHPLQAMREGDNERLEVKASKDSKFVAGEGWHADVTCDVEPPMGSMLYLQTTPEIGVGGDTLFANMHLAYEMLSAPMRAFLETLTAVHDGAIPWVQGYGYRPNQTFQVNEHPVVVRHPETGRKLLYVNRGFTSHIPQLARFESAALLEMLYRHIETQPALACRVRWTPDTLVFWDNRCTQHHAVWDYYPLDRAGHRVSIVGERPVA